MYDVMIYIISTIIYIYIFLEIVKDFYFILLTGTNPFFLQYSGMHVNTLLISRRKATTIRRSRM